MYTQKKALYIPFLLSTQMGFKALGLSFP